METVQAIMLVVTIFFADKPTITHREPMPDLQSCMQEAEEFLNHTFPEEVGSTGQAAGCLIPHVKTEKS